MLQMADHPKFNDLASFDFGKLEVSFRKTQISDTDYLFQTTVPSIFPLKFFIFADIQTAVDRLTALAATDLKASCYFVLSEDLAPWVTPLLRAGAFDVAVGSPRWPELFGKFEYFFSETHQTKIFKSNPPFKLDLTKKEQQLFDFLLSYPRGVNRQELMTLCWKDLSVHPKTLDVHLFNLRQKLETVGAVIRFTDGKWMLDFGQ